MFDGLKRGRVVYYAGYDGLEHAAIVTHVWDGESGTVNLAVFEDSAGTAPVGDVTRKTSVPYSGETTPHTWHWMFAEQGNRYAVGQAKADETEARLKKLEEMVERAYRPGGPVERDGFVGERG